MPIPVSRIFDDYVDVSKIFDQIRQLSVIWDTEMLMWRHQDMSCLWPNDTHCCCPLELSNIHL